VEAASESVREMMVSRRTGFTLVEVLVASTIGSFIALVAVGSLRVIIGGSEAVEHNINAAAEVRFAANMIAKDLANFYRDKNYSNTRFIGTVEELDDGSSTSYIVFYAVSRTKARVGQPEGDIYEVEYYVAKDEESSLLMRRQWPNPHEELEPGGILTAIAENIEMFEIRYFDGEEWAEEWPEEIQSLPHLAEVTVVAKPSGRGIPPIESVIVNFVRAQGGEGGAVAGGAIPQTGQQTSTTGGANVSSGGDR